MSTDDLDAFRWRLAETIAWCAPRASIYDPVNSLRPPALRPSSRPESVFGEDDCDDNTWSGYLHAQGPERTAADVDLVAKERAMLLRWANAHPGVMSRDLAGGRLLLSAPDYGFFDGASEAESRGFIDVGDAPPWDTWVWFVLGDVASEHFYDSYIVSWVPPKYLAAADAGIRVSFVDVIAWASDVDSVFTNRLRAIGVA